MVRLRATISKNIKYYSIIEDYYRNGKRTTKTLVTLGNDKKIADLALKENIDVETYLNNCLDIYKNSHLNETEEIIIKKYSNRIIPKNVNNNFNVGYLFLKSIYHSLKINKIVKEISEKYKFEFDLNEVLSNLVFSRIIYPSSKLKTYELSKSFIETPKYNLENIYRGLTYLNTEMDFIQKEIYNNSKLIIDRNTRIMYFDCTNYYFDINEENDFQKYGKGKDGKSKPLVGMGLFMDGNGLPIAMNIYPGSDSETKKLIPLQEKIEKDFDLVNKQTIICTDAAMCTDEIKQFNIKDNKAFVITQSIKKLREEYQKEIFKDSNWRIIGDLSKVYKLSEILSDDELTKKHYETIFYKIVPTETAHVVQDLIVTFCFKYFDYNRNIRNSQIERAKKSIETNNVTRKGKNQNDYRRLIETISTTSTGEVVEKETYSINQKLIEEEEKYDGFYALTTNLIGDISEILKIVKGRWEIEESFRIMKSDFLARPVNLSREDRIKSHFLTCFISLFIYRLLEKKLNYNYTTSEILKTLRNMEMLEHKGIGFEPIYERTTLTDNLHNIFNFNTDIEIVTYKKIKKILD